MDASGNLTSTRSYDVYGATRAGTGTPTSKQGFVGQLGHETEPATGGLIYMRARWYDPGAGRFISEDPGRNGGNWFGYCDGNPTGEVDQSGRNGGPPAGIAKTADTVAAAIMLWGWNMIKDGAAEACKGALWMTGGQGLQLVADALGPAAAGMFMEGVAAEASGATGIMAGVEAIVLGSTAITAAWMIYTSDDEIASSLVGSD